MRDCPLPRCGPRRGGRRRRPHPGHGRRRRNDRARLARGPAVSSTSHRWPLPPPLLVDDLHSREPPRGLGGRDDNRSETPSARHFEVSGGPILVVRLEAVPWPPRSPTRNRSRTSERDYGGVVGAGIGGDDEMPVGEPCSSWSACCRSPTIFWTCCW